VRCNRVSDYRPIFFFYESLTGERYLQFLINELPALLEDVPLEIRANMFFQHDGCPAHFAIQVRTFLNQRYPDQWIGSSLLDAYIAYICRSADLTCLDFYLWGRIKAIVFSSIPTTRENMKQRIRDAIRSLPAAEIEAAVESTRQRVQNCIENDGRQFEHLGRH